MHAHLSFFCRWFTALSQLVLGGIRKSFAGTLDLQDRHAADADDVCFALAAASLFAASYASLPPHSMLSRSHTFALLQMLGVPWTFFCAGLLVRLLTRAVCGSAGDSDTERGGQNNRTTV